MKNLLIAVLPAMIATASGGASPFWFSLLLSVASGAAAWLVFSYAWRQGAEKGGRP